MIVVSLTFDRVHQNRVACVNGEILAANEIEGKRAKRSSFWRRLHQRNDRKLSLPLAI
jgi:hypothetical protein